MSPKGVRKVLRVWIKGVSARCLWVAQGVPRASEVLFESLSLSFGNFCCVWRPGAFVEYVCRFFMFLQLG